MTMKTTSRITSLLLGAALLAAGPSLAATFSASTTAPATDGADIANLDQTNAFADFQSSVLWGDRPARGQTFTTGADENGYTLSSVTVQSTGAQAANGSYTVRVGQISGSSILVIADETTGTVTDDVAADDYITFTLDTPIRLLPNTVYGFDIGRQGSGWQLKNNITEDYTDGTAYTSGANGFGGSTISTHSQNRIFHLDMEVSPEDTTKPTITDITDNVGGGPIYEDRVEILYTLTFDEAIDLATIDLADFENLGSGVSLDSLEEVAEIGGPFPMPSVITARFGISGTGTLQLGVASTSDIADNFGNTVNSPVADGTIITVNSGPTPNTPGDRFWDGNITSGITDGVSQGGNGTWNTTNTNWDPGLGFADPIAWNNTNLDTAILGGANGTITLGDAITAGGITSSATYTINSNTLTFDVASGTPVIDTASGTLTINSKISGDKGLEKTGAGVIRFSTSTTTHDYSGGFTLSQGELNVEGQGSNSSFLGTGTFTINGGTLIRMSRSTGVAWTSDNDNIWTGGTIFFTRPSGDNPKWQNDGDIILQGNVTLDRSGSVNFGVIMNGDISEDGGSFSLTLNGGTNTSSEFTLAGNNTYSGGTTIGSRSLFLNSSGALGTGPLAMNGTILDNTSGSPVTIGNANPINLNGNITFTGSNDLNLGTGAVTMNANRTVTVNNAGTLTVGGAIGQTGGDRTLQKSGNGTLELRGLNSYTGNTTVTAGTLALVGGSQDSAITVNSGAALGFTLGSPTESSKAVTLSAGHAIAITGMVDDESDYLLMIATSFTGTPTLSAAIDDYELELREGNTELWLTFTGTSGSPYDIWADGTFANGTLTDKTPTGDNDSDGLSNLLEFAFGTDPTVSDAGPLTWDGTDFTPGSPVVHVDFPGEGVDFTARFIRRTDHGDSGSAAYAWEFSSDLDDWETSSADPAPGWFAAPTVLATQGDYELVELPYPFFLDNGKKARFFRVEVSLVP